LLITRLDDLDGDEHLEEPGDVEPNLGWTAMPAGSMIDTGEREEESDLEPGTDDEFSLGWTAYIDQTARERRGVPRFSIIDGDLEAEHDGREPDPDLEANGDDEPSDWEAGHGNCALGN